LRYADARADGDGLADLTPEAGKEVLGGWAAGGGVAQDDEQEDRGTRPGQHMRAPVRELLVVYGSPQNPASVAARVAAPGARYTLS
jgi:hypothetical protein